MQEYLGNLFIYRVLALHWNRWDNCFCLTVSCGQSVWQGRSRRHNTTGSRACFLTSNATRNCAASPWIASPKVEVSDSRGHKTTATSWKLLVNENVWVLWYVPVTVSQRIHEKFTCIRWRRWFDRRFGRRFNSGDTLTRAHCVDVDIEGTAIKLFLRYQCLARVSDPLPQIE